MSRMPHPLGDSGQLLKSQGMRITSNPSPTSPSSLVLRKLMYLHVVDMVTLDDGVVRATVEEYPGSLLSTVVHDVVLDTHMVAPLRGDDAMLAVTPDLTRQFED